jgi:hypothetical protein
MKPRVVVAQPLVWGVCNVIRSGLAGQLGREFRPGYAIPPEAREGLPREGIPESDTWVLEKRAAACAHSGNRLHVVNVCE